MILFFMTTSSYINFPRFLFSVLSAWVSDLHPDTSLMIWWSLASCSYLATGHRHMHTNWLEALCMWVGLLSTVFTVDRSSSTLSGETLWYCKLDCLPGWSDPQRMLSRSCAWPVPRPSIVGTELEGEVEAQGATVSFSFFFLLSQKPCILSSASPSRVWCT